MSPAEEIVSCSRAMQARWYVLPLLLFLAACGEDDEPTGAPPAEEEAELDAEAARGQALYQRYCSLCHGEDAKGYQADNAPSLASPEFLRSASDRFLTRAIADGRPGTPMSAFSKQRGGPLEDGEIEAIVAYLRSLSDEPRVVVDGVRVLGDARRGRGVYAQHCVSCHGGRGEGVDTLSLANPALLSTASPGFLQYAVARGRTGTRMPAFGARLTPQQIDDVVTFIRGLSGDAGVPVPLPPPPEEPPQIPALTEMDLVVNPDGPAARLTLRDNRFVPAAQVKRELERGARMVIIDARATSDWLSRRIPGAIPVPYYELSDILDDLPRDGTWMVAYCGCPHAASGAVVDALRAAGFEHTAVLDEGVYHWIDQGYPTETGPID